TQDDAARQLGWSVRTLSRRLEEGLAALAGRLNRRGMTVPAALSAALLSDCFAAAAPAPELAATTIDAAWKVLSGQTVTACGVPAAVSHLLDGGWIMSAKKSLLTLVLAISAAAAAIGSAFWAETSLAQKGPPYKVTIVEGKSDGLDGVVVGEPII